MRVPSSFPSIDRQSCRCVLTVLFGLMLLCVVINGTSAHGAERAVEAALADQPFALWTFDPTASSIDAAAATTAPSNDNSSGDDDTPAVELSTPNLQNIIGDGSTLLLVNRGEKAASAPGPRPSEFPDFSPSNQGIRLGTKNSYLALSDPGAESLLDFANGDSITMECWVRWEGTLAGTFPYLMGKGRTYRPGFARENQNYSLRLANAEQGGVYLSFLFGTQPTADVPSGEKLFHRWNSTNAIPEDGAWHHVAMTYTFGKPDSAVAYIDGVSTKGKWDLGGATTDAPVNDDDELWIGASMGGTSTFTGELDNVALYRTALSQKQLQQHAKINLEQGTLQLGLVDAATVPNDRVRVEAMTGVPVAKSWKFRLKPLTSIYETDTFAIEELPQEYNASGLAIDRPLPLLLHLSTRLTLPAGEHEFVVRTLDSAKLFVDGKLLTTTGHMDTNSSAHGKYYDLPPLGDAVLSVPAGHVDQRVKVTLDAGEHVVSLYRLVGHKGKSQYVGELAVGVGPVGGPYRFVSPTRDVPFTDAGWLDLRAQHDGDRRKWEQNVRLTKSQAEQKYWDLRHAYAREVIHTRRQRGTAAETSGAGTDVDSFSVDTFIERKLAAEGERSMPLADDYAFLRRVTLDTTGTIPTPAQVDAYFADTADRRKNVIERLLADPSWADHWVGYWQDVLAENPGLTKPELNNTGPFRWFLYDSFVDNKPMDRFVTELVQMEGSRFGGGPSGFGMASQNDVPMAAKAHILGTAFLGVEMKCARCHDAPYHDLEQRDLFSIAAMLSRAPQKVPGSSSIPATPEELEKMVVKVTLKPGESVKPNWPFAEFVSLTTPPHHDAKSAAQTAPPAEFPIPQLLLRDPDDSREQLAAQMTSPHNRRFAKVLVNRVWKRYLGRGLIASADDWEDADCSHPELLEWLADEFIAHDYDLKHLARLILTSKTYQRIPTAYGSDATEAALFAGPVRRRMTGEQIADSLMHASGKDYNSEELTMDADGKQSMSAFIQLGNPTRAWQFVAVANERDRPSLNLPVAQSVIDLMAAYGWRQQRQEPLTDRDDGATPLQPMALAHGTVANRVVDLSDDSAFTTLAMQDQSIESLLEALFLRILTRPPTTAERQRFQTLLEPGYADRVIADAVSQPRRIVRSGITWANHFDPRSDVEAITRQREVLEGDRPTARLQADWRERAEDAIWSLLNHPEFVFIP